MQWLLPASPHNTLHPPASLCLRTRCVWSSAPLSTTKVPDWQCWYDICNYSHLFITLSENSLFGLLVWHMSWIQIWPRTLSVFLLNKKKKTFPLNHRCYPECWWDMSACLCPSCSGPSCFLSVEGFNRIPKSSTAQKDSSNFCQRSL